MTEEATSAAAAAVETATVPAEAPSDPAADPTPASPSVTGGGAHAAERPGTLGIWAFVLAVLGVIGLLPIVGSVLGFVLGRVALRQSERRRLRGGRGLALAAVIISVVTLVIYALSIAAYALVVAYLEI